MTFKKIMIAFCLGLPICVAARVFQIVYTIDGVTAFYLKDFEIKGTLLLVLIAAITALVFFLGCKAYKTPTNPPQHNFALTVMSLAMAAALGNEFLHKKFPPTTLMWQVTMVKILTVLAIAYFLALALQGLFNFEILPMLHLIPALFAIAETISGFISVSSLATISDNILLIAAYCLLMVFFINYAKLYNGIDIEYNFKKILATGLATTIVCTAQSVAYFGVNIFGIQGYWHTDYNTMITILCFGIFSLVFTVSHFRKTA